MQPDQKLFVLVRNDLSRSQKAVQAGHAVAQFCIEQPGKWVNGTLVYLKVADEKELDEWFGTKLFGATRTFFCEPDRDNEMTAIAALGVDEYVKDLPLL